MAILDTVKKGYMYLKTASGYVKLLPRTLASLVSMNDGTTVQSQIDTINNNLKNIGVEYWSGIKNNYSYSKKENWDNTSISVTIPAGTYLFTLKASPCAKGAAYDAFTMGISNMNTTRVQSTHYMNYGNDFYPMLTNAFVEKVTGGTYGVAFWSSQNRNINNIELRAIRIK